MHRLFLDANVLFSAAYKPGSRLLLLWDLQDVVLCSSRYALEEARVNLDDAALHARLDRLARKLTLFEATGVEHQNVANLPAKDMPILMAAIQARATHLLTGDVRHFGPYFGRQVEGVLILLPGEYLRKR